MRSLMKLVLYVAMLSLSACENNQLPTGYQQPFPQNAENYSLHYIQAPRDESAIILVQFTYSLDPNFQKINSLKYRDRLLDILNDDQSLSISKTLEETPFHTETKEAPAAGAASPLSGEVYCSVLDENTQTAQCIVMTEVIPAEPLLFRIITEMGIATFRENITLPDGSATIPAGMEIPFVLGTPDLDLSKATLLDVSPEAAAEAAAQAVAAVQAQAAGPAAVAPPADAAADPAAAHEVTINGKKYSCSGLGDDFSCSEIRNPAAKSGDSSGCSLVLPR